CVSINTDEVRDALSGVRIDTGKTLNRVAVAALRAQAVCRSRPTAVAVVTQRKYRAWAKLQQVYIVTSADWEVVNGLIVQRAAESRAGCVHKRQLFRDRDGLRLSARLQDDINSNVLTDT